jgi:PAS domain S-box-containing protein
VYRIAQAAENASTLDDLYERVHSIIGEVMPAQNFYIALYDPKKDLVSFPYFVDEIDDRPEPKRPGKGLTEYVLRKGVSLLCDQELDKKLQETGETELIGVYSPVWLGVPLILDNKTIGVMVVQHYSDPAAYGKPEQQILEFVSSQVARTIDRKRAEEVLRENEERYRIIAEQTGQLVYDYDVASGRITWSGAITSMTGYTADEFQEIDITQWEQHIHPDDRGEAVEFLKAALAGGEKYAVEYRFRRKEGSYIHVQDHGVFLHDQNNKPYRMLGTMNDTTERKQLEGQLVQSQKMEAVGQLASGIAHDFNNVMGVVLTATHLIKTVAANSDIERYTNMIEGATLRGSAIAKQLLQFSRAEASRLVPISLSHVVTEVKKILDHSFPKTVQIRVNINVDEGMVMGDESQIHQVLLNLCINARDAMTASPESEPEGVLTIIVESVPTGFAMLPSGMSGEDFVALRVRDTGSGITDEVRRRMFDPFFTTKEIGKGTGLGLSIVHGIVRNHHAHIDAESEPGKGTTFSIYFPVVKHRAEELRKEISVDTAGGGETILVIEDETALRELMKEILSRNGYTVLDAKDGEQGVYVYRRSWRSIDLVLSDIGLPRLSGEGVLRELEKINPAVKLIFCTGFLDGERRADLLRTGAVEVIHKPYRVSEILNSVRRALSGRPATRNAEPRLDLM